MKILKIIYYNFLVFLALIILIEVFFGYWFKDENFGIYMRKERKINWQTSSNFNGKVYNFSYKRNYWGFRGEEFDPKNVQVIFEGGSTGNQRFTPQKLTIVGLINEKFRLSNVNINIYTGKTYLKHKNKIIKGAIINNKPRKDFRFQLLMCTTRYEFNNTFNILYYENKYTKHFYALNKNNID